MPFRSTRRFTLRADTLAVFCRALDFLGVSNDKEAAASAVRHADFAELRRQEREKGFRERVPGQEVFFRKGRVGGWRRHLTEAQVPAIEKAHAPMMAWLGCDRVTEE